MLFHKRVVRTNFDIRFTEMAIYTLENSQKFYGFDKEDRESKSNYEALLLRNPLCQNVLFIIHNRTSKIIILSFVDSVLFYRQIL